MTCPTKKAISDLFANDGPLNDLLTHRNGWYNALVIAMEKAAEEGNDEDVRYYEHEIAVFDRAFNEVKKLAGVDADYYTAGFKAAIRADEHGVAQAPLTPSKEAPPLASYDSLPCSVCETVTPPKSVTVNHSGKVSVAYQCGHCKTSWRIADDGAQTHFRHGGAA